MLPFLAPIISMIAGKGLDVLSNAIEGGADKAIDFVSEKTGIDLTKGSITDEEIAELQKLQRKHEKELLAYHVENTKNARKMQSDALAQDDKFSKRFIYVFAAFWSIAAVVFMFAVTFGDIPKGNERFADTIMGFLLGTIVATIINFFYGSSKGSQDKDVLIGNK